MAGLTRFRPGTRARLTQGAAAWRERERIERTPPLRFKDLDREPPVLVLACVEERDRAGELMHYAFVLTRQRGAVWVCCFNMRGAS